MLKFQLQVPVRLYEWEDRDEKTGPNMLLTKNIELPLDFVPDEFELYLYGGGAGLRTTFSVARTSYDFTTEALVVFTKKQEWHEKSWRPHLNRMKEAGWDFTLPS